VVGPVLNKRPAETKEFFILEKLHDFQKNYPACPSCGSEVFKNKDEVMYYCTNAACPAQLQEHIQHFCGSSAMDIRGVGEALSEALLKTNHVNDVADLYYLKQEQLENLERMGQKSATKLIDQIGKSKERPLARLVFALGIRHVGEEMAERLVKRFPSINGLKQASFEELIAVSTVGPKIAESIISFFKIERNLQIISKLEQAGVKTKQETPVKTEDLPLSGLEFVITGKLHSFSRDEAEKRIKKLGGSTKNDITRKTSYLVVGEDSGSKLTRAQALGIKRINEETLLNMLVLNKLL
jgi:DNA ligase (NAD+)